MNTNQSDSPLDFHPDWSKTQTLAQKQHTSSKKELLHDNAKSPRTDKMPEVRQRECTQQLASHHHPGMDKQIAFCLYGRNFR